MNTQHTIIAAAFALAFSATVQAQSFPPEHLNNPAMEYSVDQSASAYPLETPWYRESHITDLTEIELQESADMGMFAEGGLAVRPWYLGAN